MQHHALSGYKTSSATPPHTHNLHNLVLYADTRYPNQIFHFGLCSAGISSGALALCRPSGHSLNQLRCAQIGGC
jgi:hypothetical protein